MGGQFKASLRGSKDMPFKQISILSRINSNKISHSISKNNIGLIDENDNGDKMTNIREINLESKIFNTTNII